MVKNAPELTQIFVQLVIIDVLIDSISYPVMAVVQATGKIKLYQSVVVGCLILNLPISYIFLKLGFPAQTVFIVAIVLSALALILRILITQSLISYNLILPFLKLLLHFTLLTILASINRQHCSCLHRRLDSLSKKNPCKIRNRQSV